MNQKTHRRGRPKSFYAKPEQNTVQSLDRALSVLQLLSARGGMTLTEISEALDQSPATIYRVLTTFEARGVAEVAPRTQVWHIGAEAFRIGSAFLRNTGLLERSRPVMRALMEETGETANLGIAKGGNVMFVSQVEANETIRAFFPPGTVSPLHASGIGKALLSAYDDARLERFLSGYDLAEFTEKTLTDAAALRADLHAARDRGYALDDEEKSPGMRCVAAPVRDAFGEAVAGISVSGPTARMGPDQIEGIGERVRGAAARLSRALGAPEG